MRSREHWKKMKDAVAVFLMLAVVGLAAIFFSTLILIENLFHRTVDRFGT